MHAGENLHQRALPGAVFSHQRMHFAALQIEVDVVQRRHASEGLGNAGSDEDDAPARCGPIDLPRICGRARGRPCILRSGAVRPHPHRRPVPIFRREPRSDSGPEGNTIATETDMLVI